MGSTRPEASRRSDQQRMKVDVLWLARARLRGRLERAASFPILVVCAPAGFGKTTALREFFAAGNRPHRRVEITPNHGDLLAFMRTFAADLSDVVPALLASLVDLNDRSHWEERAADEIATSVSVHLAGLELTLIVDGVEHITDERLFALLSALIDRTSSSRLRWILVGERADRFPIARWLANDRMDIPIDHIDLALTYDDLAAAGEHAAAPLALATVREISQQAGDWPASIALALRAAGEPGSALPWTGGPRPYAYFAERAFAARSDREQRFLLETCIFRKLDADILNAAGWSDGQPFLRQFAEVGVMLFAGAGGTYEYHEIFGRFLVERLQAEPGDRYEHVRHAAAGVYERTGRPSAALELYLELKEPLAVAALLSGCGFDLLDRGEVELVQRALGGLRDADFVAFPIALAVKASLESLRGSFDLAEAWFVHAIELAGDSGRRGTIVFRFATDLVRRDRRDAIELLEPIVAGAGHERGLAVSLAGLLATAYATHGQAAAAATTIERALEQLTDVDDPAVRAKLYFQAGYVAFFGHDLGRAKTFAKQAVETATTAQLYDIAARALSILYNIALDYDDDVRAGRRYLNELAACSVKAGSRDLLVYATLAQFEVEVYGGNLAQSARLDAALQLLEIGYSLLTSETLLPAQALRATWSGDFARAYRLISPTAEKQITSSRRAQRHAEIALYAAAAGWPGEARAAVRDALAIASAQDPADTSIAFTWVYIALALHLLGRHRRAALVLSSLERSAVRRPRLTQLCEAVAAVSGRWECGRYSNDLGAALERLDTCGFGGIGRLIEALPLPELLRSPLAKARPQLAAVLGPSSADVG